MDHRWSVGGNWEGNAAPQSGDALVFTTPGLTDSHDDLPDGHVVGGITAVGAHNVSGVGTMTLSGGIAVGRHPSAPGTAGGLTLPVVALANDAGITMSEGSGLSVATLDLAGHTATVTGSGTATLAVRGSGIVVLQHEAARATVQGLAELSDLTVVQGQAITTSGGTLGALQLRGGWLAFAGTARSLEATGGRLNVPSGSEATVTGTARLGTGVTFDAPLGLSSQERPLKVLGSFTIDPGAVLSVQAFNVASLPYDQPTKIVDVAGTLPVAGTFRDFPEGALIGPPFTPNLVYRISYRGGDGNDVTLTRLPLRYFLATDQAKAFGYGESVTPDFGVRPVQPVVAAGLTPTLRGAWLAAADGGVFAGGDAGFFGSAGGLRLAAPIVAFAATPSGRGYWLGARDGGMFSYGDASFFGSMGGQHLNQPIVGMASTPDGHGYWLVARDGGVFTFGSAAFYGSTGAIALNQPIVGTAPTPSGRGYWLVASDGGVFSFGDAAFHGSTGAIRLNQPIVGMARTPSGAGYWLGAADGGVFTFGDAPYFGSPAGVPAGRTSGPFVAITS